MSNEPLHRARTLRRKAGEPKKAERKAIANARKDELSDKRTRRDQGQGGTQSWKRDAREAQELHDAKRADAPPIERDPNQPKLDGDALLSELEGLSADDFAALLGGGAPKRFKPGERVRGRVVRRTETAAFIDIGGKSEAILSFDDNGKKPLPPRGATVEAYVASVGGGGIHLSKGLAGQGAWAALEEALESGAPVPGEVRSRNPGGFTVRLGTVNAFCPVSQIDRIPNPELDSYVGRSLSFRVTSIEGRDVVVSHRAIAEESVADQAQARWDTLNRDDQVSAVVVAVKEFGAFVDVDGIRALIPAREFGWGSDSPAPVIGSTVDARVIHLDREADRLTLSLKSASNDPWARVGTEIVPGGDYPGTVKRLTDFGAFVALAPGLEGLVHVSELSAERVATPADAVSVGDKVTVRVIDIELDRKRLKLSIKRVGSEPATPARATLPKDTGSLGTMADLFGGLKASGGGKRAKGNKKRR